MSVGLMDEEEVVEKRGDVRYLLDIDSNDDDGNRSASEQPMHSMSLLFHKTVSKNVEDDREYSFEEETVERYENSIEELV